MNIDSRVLTFFASSQTKNVVFEGTILLAAATSSPHWFSFQSVDILDFIAT